MDTGSTLPLPSFAPPDYNFRPLAKHAGADHRIVPAMQLPEGIRCRIAQDAIQSIVWQATAHQDLHLAILKAWPTFQGLTIYGT